MAAPSAAEKRMIETVDREQERSIALLEKLVNVNSGTMNLAGVEAVARMVREELEPLGLTMKWVPQQAAGRAGHLIASKAGDGKGKRLLLIGHLDTVFEPDSGFTTFVRRGDVLEGPGTSDDKGGIVAIIAALRAMKAAGTLARTEVTVFLTGDEERVGIPRSVSRKDLLDAADKADVALDFEPLADPGGVEHGSISRRSSIAWTLRTTGKSGHSSGIFSESAGFGALYEMTRILDTFRKELREPGLTYNVGLVVGGTSAALNADETGGTANGKNNIIAGTAIARGDIRALTDEQATRVRSRMAEILAANLPGTSAEMSFAEGYPAMAETAGNRFILSTLNQINADLKLPQMPPMNPLGRGAGDISFVASRLDGIAGMGPAGEKGHSIGESISATSLVRQSKRAALLMSRLGSQPRGTGAVK
jgi:glutamate carboxypeptidase